MDLTKRQIKAIKDAMSSMSTGPMRVTSPPLATAEELKLVYIYLEKFILYLCVHFVEKKMLSPPEVIAAAVSAMKDAGEPDSQIKDAIKNMREIFEK